MTDSTKGIEPGHLPSIVPDDDNFDFGTETTIESSPIVWITIDWKVIVKVNDEPEPLNICGIFTVASHKEINLGKSVYEVLIHSGYIQPHWVVQITFEYVIIKDWKVTNENVDDKSDISVQPSLIG